MHISGYKTQLLFFCCLLLVNFKVVGQEVTLHLGPDEIAQNQKFTITILVKNERIKSYDKFPEIKGFVQRGTSSSSSTNIINGQVSSSHSIIMNYIPNEEGVFTIKPFEMKVNGQTLKSAGKKVKVGPPMQQRANNQFDPFDMFGMRRNTPQEYVDIEDDAFFALTTSKKEVYVGEGFTTTLAFYVAYNNRAPLQFYNISQQLPAILKEVRPQNCWEENFDIVNINGEPITINGKAYTQYKIYEGAFYPLNSDDITFKSVGLEMIKYKVAKNTSSYGLNRKEDYKTFKTKTKLVRVKELPPHPLRNEVAVGKFRLDESLSKLEVKTGESFNYDFDIYGEGNISGLSNPSVRESDAIDFYPPNKAQEILRRNGRVTGVKAFSYYGIPKEPGTYPFSDAIQWVFFDPYKKKYDTLKPEVVLTVLGESKKNEAISANDLGSFYDEMGAEDNQLKTIGEDKKTQLYVNLLLLCAIILTGFVVVKKV